MKFGTIMGYDCLDCVTEIQYSHASRSLYLIILSFSQIFLSQISQDLLHLGF